jgi:hypothetical protein
MGLLPGTQNSMTERQALLAKARALGMSLAPLRMIPVSELRKRVNARCAGRKEGCQKS